MKNPSMVLRILSVLVLLGALSPLAAAQDTAAQTPAQTSDLQTAYEILQSKTFVDLTHSFSPFTPVWQGFGQASFTAAADPETGRPYTIPDDGFRSEFFSFVGQYGTHIDPPAHFDPNGATLDMIPLKEMILPLVVFDATPLLTGDPNHAFSLDDLKAWEQAHGQVPQGAFAALRTDMSKDWDSDPERFKRYPFPGWSLEAVQFLFEERGVTAIGHESLDTDITEGNLPADQRPLANRSDDEPRPGARHRRTFGRDLAETQKRLGVSGQGLRHSALRGKTTTPV